MRNIFRFKEFVVDQRNCAMRINTDGVLLAAMANGNEPKNILDIGTGTGVLALMMAQKFPSAHIDAVEIETQASLTAELNFNNSIFSKRLEVYNTSIEDYKPTVKYDLIISNPPFFTKDLKNTEENKGIARHASDNFFIDLLNKVEDVLNVEGVFYFVLPINQAELFLQNSFLKGFYCVDKIFMHSDITKKPFRLIAAISKKPNENFSQKHFYIYESEKVYTEAYKSLLKPYFLDY